MVPGSDSGSVKGLLDRIQTRLRAEPKIGSRADRLVLAFDRGDLLIEGEVESVAAKKLALELAAAEYGPGALIDRLRVRPVRRVTDAELLARVGQAISADPALEHLALRLRRGVRIQNVQPASGHARGEIEIHVEAGVVTLDGDVPKLDDKRLAESLAWWVPGTRDVVNGIGVSSAEADSDDDITRALELVFSRDRTLRGAELHAHSDHRVVTLEGHVENDEQLRQAENDAWCLFGVDRVVNALHVG